MNVLLKKNTTESETMNLVSLHPGGAALTLNIAEKAGLPPGAKVLDIGCGTGAGLRLLKDTYGIDPYGIDLSEQVLSIAVSFHPDIKFKCCDAASLPYPDAYFDAVMMECVITILDDPIPALTEATRVLKKGGKLIISTLAAKDSNHSPVGKAHICHEGLTDPVDLVSFLNKLGFELVYTEDNKKELTDYMIETIMEYGSLEARISAETDLTGASVFDCCCSYDPKSITYLSFVFRYH